MAQRRRRDRVGAPFDPSSAEPLRLVPAQHRGRTHESGVEGFVGRHLVRRRAPPVRSDRAGRGAGLQLRRTPRCRVPLPRSCASRGSTRRCSSAKRRPCTSGSTTSSGTRRHRRSSSASSTSRRRSIRSRPTRAMPCGAVWPTSISPTGTSIAVSTNSGPAGASARCRRRRRRTTRSATTTVRCGHTTPLW